MTRSCFIFLFLTCYLLPLCASDSLLIYGRNLLEIGKPDSALQISNQLLSKNLHDTLHYEAMSLQANAYHELGKWDTALELHREVLKLRKNYFGDQHPLVANVYQNIGNAYFEKDIAEKAIFFFRKAKSIQEKQANSNSILASIYSSLAKTYIKKPQLDSAAYFVEEVSKINESLAEFNSEIWLNSILMRASLLQIQAKHEEAEKLLETAITNTLASPIQIVQLHIQLADYQQESGKVRAAINSYLQVLKILDTLSPEDTSRFKKRIFMNLGGAYGTLGDTEEAETYYSRVNRLKNWKEEVIFKNNLALHYQSIGELGKIENLYGQIMFLLKDNTEDPYWYAGIYQNQASYWLAKYDEDQNINHLNDGAIDFLGDAIKQYQSVPNIQTAKAACWSLLGDCYLRKADYSTAIEHYRKAERLNPNAKAIYQLKLGQVAYFQEQYNKALTYYQAIDTSTQIYQSIQLDIALAQSASLYALAEQQKEEASWQKTLELYQHTRQLLLKQQQLFRQVESGIHLRNRYYLLYDGLISTCFALSKYGTNYQQLAFQYMQESKADILRKRLERNANIKDSTLLEQERHLQSRIKTLENELEGRQWRVEKQSNDLQTLYTDLSKLQFKIDSLYPPKAEETMTTMAIVQQQLSEEQTLIEYHISKDAIFVLTVSKHTFEFYRLPKSPHFEVDVIELCQAIRAYKNTKTYESYHRLAYQLYRELLVPLKDLKKELIIIPTGVLRYLPFEALLTASTEIGLERRFDKCAFLIKDFDISYAHRMDLWHTEQKTGLAPNILTVAPIFQADDSRNLDSLKHNQEEGEEIYTLLGGELWLGANALADNFKRVCSEYNILHLSTHGVLNTDTPEASFLAFSEVEGAETNQISVEDIYYLNIVADLVVLSACETQLGKNIQGEGLLSMARAFTAAGAKSVVASLWSIQDKATSILMKHFYENLQILPKNKALSQAKRDYLEQLETNIADASHPYLWSACVLIGDVDSVALPTPSYRFVWYVLGGVLLLLLFLLIKRGRLS